MSFFVEGAQGPLITPEVVRMAESKLGVRLPQAYISRLEVQNGGDLVRRCVPSATPTSWARDHVEVAEVLGIGYPGGLDGEFGSAYTIEEWGFPRVGIVIGWTPASGHECIMLDYRGGPSVEPSVVYVDEDGTIVPLAASFAEFDEKLVSCERFDEA